MRYSKCVSAIIVAAAWHGQSLADDSDLVGKDWGCAVLMCLSNPSGSTAEPKCKPPIEKLAKEIAKGNGYPDCEGVSEHKIYDYFDPCPDGTAAAPAGSTVVTGIRKGGAIIVTSVGKKSEVQPWAYLPPSERACVGGPIGEIQAVGGLYDEGTMLLVYSSVAWQKPYPTPRAIDVYGTDGKFLERVRY